jgi:hypothetical protein
MHICRMYMATVDDVYNSARVMSEMYLVYIYMIHVYSNAFHVWILS